MRSLGTMTHDYKRNGTTTLFAALNTLDGTVIAETMPKHRAKEWLNFLKTIYRRVGGGKKTHIICDNYSTHKTQEVQKWLARHKRVQVHFTPTSGSWLKERGGVGGGDPRVLGPAQRVPEAVHLDGHPAGHSGQSRKSQGRPGQAVRSVRREAVQAPWTVRTAR